MYCQFYLAFSLSHSHNHWWEIENGFARSAHDRRNCPFRSAGFGLETGAITLSGKMSFNLPIFRTTSSFSANCNRRIIPNFKLSVCHFPTAHSVTCADTPDVWKPGCHSRPPPPIRLHYFSPHPETSTVYVAIPRHCILKNIDMQVHVPGKPGVEEEACLA